MHTVEKLLDRVVEELKEIKLVIGKQVSPDDILDVNEAADFLRIGR